MFLLSVLFKLNRVGPIDGGWGHRSSEGFFRMYGSTAFIYAFCTPPSTYFSMRSFEHHRINPLNSTSKLVVPWGSLGDIALFY